MSYNHRLPKKFDPTPKRHHGWTFIIFLFGIVLPPIAVAARFGIGSDFFLNCFLCICGYIPSHGHNFYIQNIRNNDGRKRTPKWIKKAGLVDDSEDKRRAAKSQWAKRYDERLPNSTLDEADLAEGEEGGNYVPSRTIDEEEVARRRREGLWSNEDEEYYNEEREHDRAPNQQHWHYPANFEGAEATPSKSLGLPGFSGSKKKAKKPDPHTYTSNSNADRPWDAQFDDDVPEWGREYGSRGGSGTAAGRGRAGTESSDGYGGGNGNAYGSAGGGGNKRDSARVGGGRAERDEDWDHQF
ncbi:hypothetical protein FFLO_00786 [Filobasidium floriforme]|uniref:Uncharacterized protein n=1 Tax=Filobasidium floriforme TaxID=5210 RepID=A0A8K0JRM0_9TREE|nr:uncharacterized protein HD553DRAFT_328652 [Filobasidium floriforme]KAG7571274.1 hypothetical protein FFLO_00786 [Filobasidium floriforme]KAH8085847.1 hypothetical protein HD553DRAFT_328652 [Filobasidium floriforme]